MNPPRGVTEEPVEVDTDEWPEEPDIPGALEPDPLPLHALPSVLREQVESVAKSLQVPTDLPLMLGLGTVSACVAGKVEVEVRAGWTEPVGIYTAAILPAASRKSPAFAAMTSPLKEWESEQIREAAPKVQVAKDTVDVLEKKLDRVKTDAVKGNATMDDLEAARNELEKARAKIPADGRILGGDITAEALVQRLAEQSGRLAILEPEPGPLQLLAGRYSDSARLDELKKCWSAEGIMVDRVGRPPVRVERPALTLALCLQPGVLENLQNGKAFRYEGVLARFLWVVPPHGLGTRLTGLEVPPLDQEAADRLSRVLRTLADTEPAKDNAGNPRPHVLRLSGQAREVLHAFEAEVEGHLADGGRFESVRDWAGKCVGQAVRVAALLELMEQAGPPPFLANVTVSSPSMRCAVQLMRALSTHAMAVLSPTDPKTVLLRYVLDRAIELVEDPPEEGGASLRNLHERTRGRVALATMDDLRPLVDELVDPRACIRLLDRNKPTGGRPLGPTIQIHPDIARDIRKSRTSATHGLSEETSVGFADASSTPGPDVDDLLNVEVVVT